MKLTTEQVVQVIEKAIEYLGNGTPERHGVLCAIIRDAIIYVQPSTDIEYRIDAYMYGKELLNEYLHVHRTIWY